MFKNQKFIFLRTKIKFFITFFAIIFVVNFDAYAQFGGSSELVREIEKSLLFDKETQEKFDIYNQEYGSNKLDKPTIGDTISNKDKQEYSKDDMDIVLVDKNKIDRDMREKEKLAYNSALIGQYENALELYKEILKKEPNNQNIKFAMAVVYQRLGQYKQAKNIYQELLKAGAENKEEIINNIITILVEESPREAINVLNRLAIQNPETAFLFANISLAYEKLSNTKLAIENSVKALQIDKKNPNYSYNLAILYDKSKDYENAIEMYSLTLKNLNGNSSNIAPENIKKRIDLIKNLI